MKKSLIYILAVAAGLYSCDPYKDIHSDVEQDLAAQRDNDAIPETLEISADDMVFPSRKEAQDSIPGYLGNKYVASKYTDGKIMEVTYTVDAQVMAPKVFLSESDYVAANTEHCKTVDEWVVDEDKTYDDAEVKIDLEQADFDYLGFRYPNFSTSDYKAGTHKGYYYDSKIEVMISDILANHRNVDKTKSVVVMFEVYSADPDTIVFKAGQFTGCPYHILNSDADKVEEKITTILNNKFPDQLAGSQNNVVYQIGEINGEVNSVEDEYFQKGEDLSWKRTTDLVHDYYTLTSTDYSGFGFTDDFFTDEVKQENYLPRFLTLKYPYAQEEDVIRIKYNFEDRDVEEHIAEYSFMDGTWTQVAPLNEATVYMDKFKYKLEGSSWNLSQAIAFTLTDEDFALTGDDKYNNFGDYDDKEGTYNGETVDNIIDAKIAHIISENYSKLEVDEQEITVSYAYYSGSNSVETRNYIYDLATETWIRQ